MAAAARRLAGARPARRAARGLAQRAGRLGEVSRQLGGAGVDVERGEALGRAGVLGPQVERLQRGAGRVAVGVDGGELAGGGEERVERALAVAGGEPVGGDLGARRAGRREALGQRGVQRAAAQPLDVLVDRAAHERVPERRAARLGLGDQAGLQQLVEAGDEVERELGAGHRRGLGGRAALR